MSYDPHKTGKRIRMRRKQLHMTQQQLADRIHCSADHISRIERGKHGFSFETVCLIAEAIDVSLDFLAFGEIKRDSSTEEIIKTIQQVLDLYSKNRQ